MTNKKVSSIDVAKKAGVSQASVSMILNHKYNVSFSKETIKKVEEAAKELGYILPSKKANKTVKKEKIILVFCPNLANPYYTMLIEGIETRANEMGLGIYVCNTRRSQKMEEYYIEMAGQMKPSGIIFTFNPNHVFLEKIEKIGQEVPVAVINNQNEKIGIDMVDLDNSKIGKIIAQYLLSLGHKKAAYITTPLTTTQNQRSKRVEGFVKEFVKNGYDKGVIIKKPEEADAKYTNVDSEYRIGYDFTKEIISTNREVTAIVGLNDMIALGILDALLDERIKVPQEVSVIGCDNILFSGLRGVSLTTVEHYVLYKGRDACDIILKKMDSRRGIYHESPPITTYHIEYEPKLIIRGSSSYPRRKQNKNK